jgi:acyl transferase domain-containing protein/thioesterase domain-containing protein
MNDSPAINAPLIAVVGMAGRFPGARNVKEFWRNLRDGVESISPLDDYQLQTAGVDDALRDGDRIRAEIRGTAINNDGARKVGYFAASVAGQAEVVAEALAVAGVPADSISYIEAHGTGTAVGDPIELAALNQAFRETTQARGFCAIGSVKTNLGHLDAAAGVTGFIKTVLALEHRQLPPSLNFVKPNPLIDFASSPFFVNTQLRDWDTSGTPRRAGVTALGIGGTNAHIILEESPTPAPTGAARRCQLLTLSAKTPGALDVLTRNLADHLADSGVNLADAAYTGHFGRKALPLRRALVCHTAADAAKALFALDPKSVCSDAARETPPSITFLFPGQGSQYVAMGQELYRDEPVFRAVVDSCAEKLQPLLDLDLRTVLFPAETATEDQRAQANRLLDETRLTQPALFVVEFAMAELFEAWGIRPTAMIGHSIGEFAAACLAGVIELDDALMIVAERGRLMQTPAPGAMSAVPLAPDKVTPLLNDRLSIASINADDQCVVAGPEDAIRAFEATLGASVPYRRLRVSHAFHSGMMDGILPAFGAFIRQFTFAPPRIPFVSSATGQWFGEAEARDPDYWRRQLRQTVRFRDGAVELLKRPDAILVEVGPGNTLGTLMMRQRNFAAEHRVISSMRTRQENTPDLEVALHTLGQLWTAGYRIDWRGFHAHETRRRVALPTYPFERQRFWIEPGQPAIALAAAEPVSGDSDTASASESLFHAVWRRADRAAASSSAHEPAGWLIFRDAQGLGARIGELLRARGERYYEVVAGLRYERLDERQFQIDPARRADYDDLLAALGKEPNRANADQALRLTVRKEGRDYRLSAQTPGDQQAGEWLECAQGEAIVRPQMAPGQIDLEAIRHRCSLRALSFDSGHQNRVQEKYIAFGPRWRSLERIDLGRDEALAFVAMPPEFHADFSSYRIHPALLDMATGAAMFLIPDYASAGHLYVPAWYGSITLYGDLPAKCYSHISLKRSASADSALAAFDIVITNESGDPVIQIVDFLLREVRDPATLAAGTSRRGVVARPANLRSIAATTVADGISNAEGVAAFHRVLAAPAPNIVVFPSDFAVAVSQANPARPRAQDVTTTLGTGGVNDPVETTLLDWWRDLLGAQNPGKDDDFFALGGRSLTAVRLLARIKKTYRVDLDLAVLFEAPTVAKLARLIRRDETPATYRSIVPIRPAGTTPPLFLIHALGGRVIGYGDLARRLAAEQVVYGVEFALPDADPSHFRMEYLAANYLTELRRVQPEGPYYLPGFSFGGLLAYEMAQQLYAAGQTVAFLGMLDTWQTGHLRELESAMNMPLKAMQRVKLLLRHARTEVFSSAEFLPIVTKLGRRGGQFITDLLGSGRRAAYDLLEKAQLSVPKVLQFSNDINCFAVQKYRFLPYPGRITFFRASDGMGAVDDRYGWDLGWGRLAQAGVDVHEVTSDHLGILREPSVRELAREIAACMQKCRTAEEHSSSPAIVMSAQFERPSVGAQVSSK